MMRYFYILQRAVGGVFAFLILFLSTLSSAFALSNGCIALNALSGSTSLNFNTNVYPASAFDAGDTLTVSVTDSGSAYESEELFFDSFGLTDYEETAFQVYSASQSTSNSAHTVTLSYTVGALSTDGVRLRLTSSYGQFSNFVVTCSGTAAIPSSDATLSSLSLSDGTLSPSFSTGTTRYSTSVANSVSTITVTPTTTDANATVTVNGTTVTSGSASPAISLAAGASTAIAIVVTAEDATTNSYTLNVTRAEAAVVANNSTATVAANSSDNVITLSTSGGTASSVSVASPPAHGTATASGTSITYTPTAGYSGSDSFSWNATNSAGTSANATVDLTVTAPTLTFSPAAGALPAATTDSAWSQTLTATGGTAPYSWSATGLPTGLTLNSSTGVISGTPTQTGSFSIQVTATDSNSASSTVNYTLNVTAGGTAPVANDVTATVDSGSNDNSITLAIAGAVTSLKIVRQASHGTALVSGTSIRYTPVSGYSGSDNFTYSATNAWGTSQEATVSLTVTATSLTMSPASGTLPTATAGSAYRQTFSVSGGTTPYSWQLNGSLPQGLTFANGELKGTPNAAGTASFTLIATDANAASVQSAYTLTINAAAPVAADHSASLYAGQSVKVNLVEGATGGPFTGARLLDQPQSSLGSATIQSSGATYQLLFTAAAQASGTVALRYELTSSTGTTQPATVTLTIAARPNPATDADVIGLISAQVQAAQNFAKAQIRNFNDRLEQLHSGVSLPSGHNGIHFNMPTSRSERETDKDLWASAWQQQRKYQEEHPQAQSPVNPFTARNEDNRLSWWTGGYIDFGSNKDDVVRFSHTLVGITTGSDYRFTPSFTAGMGIGFGRDVSDVGDSGSRENGRSISSALYGSWHPDAFFIDGLLGYSSLEFDSKRYVSESDAFARGSRSGRQVFSSLTSGYEFRTVSSLISPYARIQYYRTWLDGYAESDAGLFNLAFAPQTFAQVVTTAGLRGEHSVPTSWGFVKLQSRLEYSQLMNDNGKARVGYADVGNDTWSMSLYQQSTQTLALGVGLDFLLPHDITPGIAYQGTLGLDEQQTRSQMIMVRVNIGF